MTTTFNLLNHAMLNQVLYELRHGRLQRCKALGLADEDIEVLQSLPPTTLSHLAHSVHSLGGGQSRHDRAATPHRPGRTGNKTSG